MNQNEKQIEFVQVSTNEIKFNFKEYSFMLVEQNRGVYSMGRAVQLYQLDGLKKEHVKEIAWTKDDGGYGGRLKSDAYFKEHCVSMEACKNLATQYLFKAL
jgi:hypothetical protein